MTVLYLYPPDVPMILPLSWKRRMSPPLVFRRIFLATLPVLISAQSRDEIDQRTVPASVILGLCVATILNQQIRLRSFFRTVTYLPWVMSMVVASTLWRWLYSREYGLLNYFLNQIGLPGSYWHTDPATAMLSVIIVGVWKSVGWNVVVFLAGLQGIPTSLYEAAQIDGANSRQQFAYITLPLHS